MKKSLYFLLGLFILFPFTCHADEPKTTAAVMDLQAQEGVSQGVSNVLSDYLRTQLVNTNKFTLVTRENMEQVLKEQNFQLSGCTSQECIVQVGQLLGVRKIFAGSIGKVGATYVINLKIIDIESGKIEKAVTEECTKCEEDALLTSITNIANKIVGITITQLPLKELKVPPSVEKWQYDGGSYDEGRGIAVDSSGNVYVTGYSCGANDDYLTIKYRQY